MQPDVAVLGPIGVRPFTLGACESNRGHEHNYDHTTIVIRGRLKVLYEYERDGETIKGESGELGPGQWLVIKAKVRHTLVALEENTHYLCVFSHRDFDGVVVEDYEASMGNHRAYT